MTIASDHQEMLSALPEAVLHIGGQRRRESSAGTMTHIDPTTGLATRDYPIAGAAEINEAVKAARGAAAAWRKTPAPQRRDYLLAIADRLIAEQDRLATICALDTGTPVIAGVGLASAVPANWFRYYAGWADKLDGRTPASNDENSFWYTRRVPYGVVGLVTAFNAPMAFVGMKVACALAAGNVVVLKASELTPWAVLRFAEICEEIGLPAGVLNVLPGAQEAGETLVQHPDVDRISFTGSDATAKIIMAQAAANLTPVSFELGGKSASIIFDDAKLEQAAGLSIQGSIALLSGQACIAGTRILVQRGVVDQVTELLCGIGGSLPVGDPRLQSTVIGPIVNQHHCNRIERVIERAEKNGEGRLVAGGRRAGGELADGFFLPATVFADVDPASPLAQDEIFGPVLSVIPFDTEEDALRIANDSRYGLAGYVFTENLGRAHRVAQGIEAGLITVNSAYTVPANVPFGGFKASGFGREGGEEGILEMTHCQSIQIGLN